MPNPNTVTVVIPAFNAAAFIATAVNSVLRQTVPVHEILVVDDASTDDTVTVVTALCADIPSLRLLSMPSNGGPSAARNRGFDQATGDWIAILDADDAFEPLRLESLLAIADDTDILADDIAYYDYGAGVYCGSCLERLGQAPFDITLKQFVAHNQATAKDWGLLKPMFRRSFLEAHGLRYPIARRHGEDFDLLVACLIAGGRFRCLPEPLYRYTMPHGTVSNSVSGFSRTVNDYHGMSIMALEWAADPRLAGDAETRALLMARSHKLGRVAEWYVMLGCLKQRQVGQLLKMIAARPAFAFVLGQHLVIHARSKLRRR